MYVYYSFASIFSMHIAYMYSVVLVNYNFNN